jgi:type IV pilus assembly protein PilW
MKLNHKRFATYQVGLSLVEVMVGMAIGLLVALIIMQVMSVFEGQKRATTGTADAQTNGSIGLYNIGREMQFAGFPLMPTGIAGAADSPLECATVNFGATGITSISPVSITDGTSDTVIIRYGDSQSGGVPSPIGAVAGKQATVTNNFGCQNGDLALINQGGSCKFRMLALATDAPQGVVVTATSNLVNLKSTEADFVAADNGANLSCLGNWNTVTYAVVSGNLERNGVPVVTGVVNLQAQYGISATANSNQVTSWVEPSGATWAAPTVANRNLIKAVRIAVIARNSKIEPSAVTTACTQAVAPIPTTGLCAWQNVAVGGAIATASPAPAVSLIADANWARYRYRVFETIIPLRNMVWSRETL